MQFLQNLLQEQNPWFFSWRYGYSDNTPISQLLLLDVALWLSSDRWDGGRGTMWQHLEVFLTKTPSICCLCSFLQSLCQDPDVAIRDLEETDRSRGWRSGWLRGAWGLEHFEEPSTLALDGLTGLSPETKIISYFVSAPLWGFSDTCSQTNHH